MRVCDKLHASHAVLQARVKAWLRLSSMVSINILGGAHLHNKEGSELMSRF